LLIAGICIAATQAVVWQIQQSGFVAAASATAFDATALPMHIGQWSGTDTELDPRLSEEIAALSMVNRIYHSAIGRQAAVHLTTSSAADVKLPHSPQGCYAGAGWTILKDDWQTDGHDRRYRLMFVELAGERAAVAYWYQLGVDTAGEHNDLRRILQRLRWQGKAWPPIVKVLIQVPVESSEDDARTAFEELGAGIYEWVKNNS
jgi:hypothetical protein